MVMPNFSSLPATPTDLDKFLTIFQEKSFSGKLLSKFQKVKFLALTYIFQLATHINAEFKLTSFYPDGLRQIFDRFSRKIHFLEKIHNFLDLKKF
jgi:archaellum biogenesis protein FlaJ (TadC family)